MNLFYDISSILFVVVVLLALAIIFLLLRFIIQSQYHIRLKSSKRLEKIELNKSMWLSIPAYVRFAFTSVLLVFTFVNLVTLIASPIAAISIYRIATKPTPTPVVISTIVPSSTPSNVDIEDTPTPISLIDVTPTFSDNITNQLREVESARFSSNGDLVVSASKDNVARVWNVNTGELIHTLRGHSRSVRDALFSSDGTMIMTVSRDITARIWNVSTGDNVSSFTQHTTNSLSGGMFYPDGSIAVTWIDSGLARVWMTQTGEEIYRLGGSPNQADSIITAAFSPNGRLLATGDRGGTVRLWEPKKGGRITQIDINSSKDKVLSVTFSDDSSLMTTSSGNVIKIWDVSGIYPSIVYDFRVDSGYINYALLSHDKKYIAISSSINSSGKKNCYIFILENSKQINLADDDCGINSDAFSNDNKRLVTTNNNNTNVWDADNGSLLIKLEGHIAKVNSARFSSDDKRIVTSSDDGTVILYSAQDYSRLRRLIP